MLRSYNASLLLTAFLGSPCRASSCTGIKPLCSEPSSRPWLRGAAPALSSAPTESPPSPGAAVRPTPQPSAGGARGRAALRRACLVPERRGRFPARRRPGAASMRPGRTGSRGRWRMRASRPAGTSAPGAQGSRSCSRPGRTPK